MKMMVNSLCLSQVTLLDSSIPGVQNLESILVSTGATTDIDGYCQDWGIIIAYIFIKFQSFSMEEIFEILGGHEVQQGEQVDSRTSTGIQSTNSTSTEKMLSTNRFSWPKFLRAFIRSIHQTLIQSTVDSLKNFAVAFHEIFPQPEPPRFDMCEFRGEVVEYGRHCTYENWSREKRLANLKKDDEILDEMAWRALGVTRPSTRPSSSNEMDEETVAEDNKSGRNVPRDLGRLVETEGAIFRQKFFGGDAVDVVSGIKRRARAELKQEVNALRLALLQMGRDEDIVEK